MVNPKLEYALQEEVKQFTTFYLWLEKSMPSHFFKDLTQEKVSLIVHSLMGFEVQNYFSHIHLKDSALILCLEAPDADLKILKEYEFYGIKDYSTYVSKESLPYDNEKHFLRIAVIYFTEAIETKEEALGSERKEQLHQFVKKHNITLTDEQSGALIDALNSRFLYSLPTDRLYKALELYFRAQSRDDCQYYVEEVNDWQEANKPSLILILAWKNTPKHHFIYRLARVIFRHNLIMNQVNAAYINPYGPESTLMLALSLHGKDSQAAWDVCDVKDFVQEVVTLKYFSSFDLIDSTFIDTHLIRGNVGNFLRALVNFVHQVLVNVDHNLYTLSNVEEGLCRHPEITLKLCQAFEWKFHPEKHNLEEFTKTKKDFFSMVQQIDTGQEENDLRRKNVLTQGMNFISHVLKNNFYRNNKTSLGFRLDPEYLNHVPFDRKKIYPELPFGIFYIKGMHFIAFHIRFKDLARGGLRTVFPEKAERMISERNTVFNECYNLAYTQHKKNKDIPEGGAKGIIFLKPYERLESEAKILKRELEFANYSTEETMSKLAAFKKEQTLEYLYQTQRSFITTLLSLVNCDHDGTLKVKNIIDYWRSPEYIYLGPDENLHDVMIEWIAHISTYYQYKPKGAFISGKPKFGINHKEYGVTSLGVNVYMHQVLKFLGIDPYKSSFTVKMTGGPDGDVAGNQIHNLYSFYPHTARLVALTDVSGTIHDPKGLDLNACNDLFKKGLSICHYPEEKLSEGGFLLDKTKRKEETPYTQLTLCYRNINGSIIEDWLSGNEMNAIYRLNVHQTKADIFIPAGGRPKTLNEANLSEFLDEQGAPTSKAIVEGANLYLTERARLELEKKGVLIIKDSSANKGGVICSSFEILCSLALSNEEFIAHKKELVEEILEKIKQLAMLEAELLLSTFQRTGQSLVFLSEEISKKINFYTDQLLNHLEKMPLDSQLTQFFLNYCPNTLREKFRDKLITEIPDTHKKAIIACFLASRLIYKKGLDWSPGLIEILPILIQEFSY